MQIKARQALCFGFLVISLAGFLSPRGVGLETPENSAPLPQAPEGVSVRAVAIFDAKEQEPVRIAAHPTTGKLYVLGGGGDVTLIDPRTGKKQRVITGSEYIEEPKRENVNIPLPIDALWVNS